MNRRTFAKSLALGMTGLSLRHMPVLAQAAPQFSITMDDFFWTNAIKLSATERNQSILNTLKSNSIKAALFVIGGNIDSKEGKQLLWEWDKAGHMIGNHSYSHRNYSAPETVVADYQQDILRAE